MRKLVTLWICFWCVPVALAQGSGWVRQTVRVNNSQVYNSFYGLHVFDTNTMIAVGSSGGIFKTTDGGATWSSKSAGGTQTLYGIHFLDGNTGWASGSERKIIKTTDGGNTWQSQYSTSSISYLEDVEAINSTTAVAVGKAGSNHVFRTTDGGQTWTAASLGVAWLQKLQFISSTLGYAVGITASSISITVDAFGGTSIRITGMRSTVWKTTDGGLTWRATILSNTVWLYGMHFVDTNTGWAVGAGGLILKTTDGGTTWTQQTSNTTQNLLAAYFVNSTTGWAVGNSGTIRKTTDGGATWRVQASGTSEQLYGVAFADSNTGWIVGTFGMILKTATAGEPQNPSMEITLDKATYSNGDVVTATVFRIKNPSSTPTQCRVEITLKFPGGQIPLVDVGADGNFRLPASIDADAGPLSIFNINSAMPRGNYEFNARLTNPANNTLYSEDINRFMIQ